MTVLSAIDTPVTSPVAPPDGHRERIGWWCRVFVQRFVVVQYQRRAVDCRGISEDQPGPDTIHLVVRRRPSVRRESTYRVMVVAVADGPIMHVQRIGCDAQPVGGFVSDHRDGVPEEAEDTRK